MMRRTFRKFEIPVDVFGKQRYTETDVRSPLRCCPQRGPFPIRRPGVGIRRGPWLEGALPAV